MSVSSGLSVAEPKYFFPAANATTDKPAVEVPVGAGDDGAVEEGAVVPDPFCYNRKSYRLHGFAMKGAGLTGKHWEKYGLPMVQV